jgi:molybdenum cofactor biosynthesis enzyme MoaA
MTLKRKLFFFGTDNPTLTIHVPNQCGNDCTFCVNKNMYDTKSGVSGSIQEAFLQVLNKMPEAAETVVISGGEPLFSYSWLEEVILPTIEKYKNEGVIKHAYLNTFLPSSRLHDFVSLIVKYGTRDKNTNKFPYLDGISISRPNLSTDSFRVNTLNDDKLAKFMRKLNEHIQKTDRLDLRINALIDHTMTETEIDKGITLYSNMGFTVSLREDFTKETPTTLRKLNDIEKSKYGFLKPEYASGCNACATFTTNRDNVTIHKGLEHTSHANIFPGGKALIEVVDVIIDPYGGVFYDWAISDEDKSKYEFTYFKKSIHLPHIYSRKTMSSFIDKLPSWESETDEEEGELDKDAIVDDIIGSLASDPIFHLP